ncbi:MAG TPA: ABC transporter substrate-binding protein [Kineosporiaceae bacterium]|nr:ABC transporter substrate-binding protein [Kineosporiaceae bacterium]
MILSTGSGRRHRRTALAGIAGTAVLALALAGCSDDASGPSKSGGDTSDVTLVVPGATGDAQANFNPFSTSSLSSLGNVYEPLFYINKTKASDPKPLLGTEYSFNDDGTELTVTTRDGVKWTDGQPFTAKDVAFTFDMIKKTPAFNNWGFNGAVKATDDSHVVFTWKQPAYVIAPDVLSGVAIVPEHIWKGIADPVTYLDKQPVGTGAFKLGTFKPQAVTFVANPGYWGGAPKLKNIRLLSVSGNQTVADGIANGTIDWETGPIPDIQNTHKNFPNYDKFTSWQNEMVLAACSNADLGCKGPQTDPAVRQALFYAIDRTQLNNLAFEKTASAISPSFALTPTQDKWISPEVNPKTAPEKADPAKASSLLEGAGWKKGSDGIYAKDGKQLSLTIEVVTGWTDYITALQAITSQAKAAGIKVETSQSSWNGWTDKKNKGNFQLMIDALYQGPTSDPYYIYTYFFTSANTAKVGKTPGLNYGRFSDPAVDSAVETLKGLNFTDTAARQAQFNIIQKSLMEKMPYIPVLTGGTTSVWNVAKFSGWPTEDNSYAFPAVWSRIDAAEVFKTLTPTGK